MDEHSIMETLIFHVAPVVVVAIVNVKVEAVADRPCSRYTINKKKVQLPKKAYTWQTSWGKEIQDWILIKNWHIIKSPFKSLLTNKLS